MLRHPLAITTEAAHELAKADQSLASLIDMAAFNAALRSAATAPEVVAAIDQAAWAGIPSDTIAEALLQLRAAYDEALLIAALAHVFTQWPSDRQSETWRVIAQRVLKGDFGLPVSDGFGSTVQESIKQALRVLEAAATVAPDVDPEVGRRLEGIRGLFARRRPWSR